MWIVDFGLDGKEHDDCDEFAKELDSVVCYTFGNFKVIS